MKYLMSLMCVMAFLVSCNEEQDSFDVQNAPSSKDGISIVSVVGDKLVSPARATEKDLALCFKDEACFNEFKEKLESLSSSEQSVMVARYGVKNLHDLALEADDELEKIGDSASTIFEFNALYEKYKEKYNGLLTTDSNDKSDVSLYVPKGESPESYIANENGCYVIGGKVVRYDASKISSVGLAKNAQTRAIVAGTNDICFRPLSNKKIYFRTYLEREYVRVEMHAKKHMWYGWKNDPARNYFFDSFIQNIKYVSLNSTGQEVVSPRLPRYVFVNKVQDGFNIILAKRVNSIQKVAGYFLVWCDYTAEHDASGKYLMEKSEGLTVPKCLESKAQKVNVDLN